MFGDDNDTKKKNKEEKIGVHMHVYCVHFTNGYAVKKETLVSYITKCEIMTITNQMRLEIMRVASF